jgi:hypothetical protein
MDNKGINKIKTPGTEVKGEDSIRVTALKLALERNRNKSNSAEGIVSDAEKFFKFLEG